MALQEWSEQICVIDLADDPQFSEDMAAVDRHLSARPSDVVLDFSEVAHVTSSNISQLLRLRQMVHRLQRQLRLCSISDGVWSIMLVTGLSEVLQFSPDVPAALASLQLR